MSEKDDRWAPDEALVPAILAGSRTTMKDLSAPDRAWAVAVLKRRYSYTNEQIADRLSCSVRLVCAIWSDAGVLVALYLSESENFGDTHRMSESEIRRLSSELADTASARDRYKKQLDRMLARADLAPKPFPCGCPRDKYNTYVAPKTQKAGCRRHRGEAVRRHRARLAQVS